MSKNNVSTKWYLLANREEAVLYKEGRDHEFKFVKRLSNPQGGLAERDLDSDKPGKGSSSAGGGSIHHALDRRSQRHEQVAKKFASKIGKILEVSRQEGRFSELVVVAEPHFLGLLRKSTSSAVQKLISHEIGHEYKQGSDAELRSQILQAIRSAE